MSNRVYSEINLHINWHVLVTCTTSESTMPKGRRRIGWTAMSRWTTRRAQAQHKSKPAQSGLKKKEGGDLVPRAKGPELHPLRSGKRPVKRA
jgi:hypothetical protein